MLADTFLVESGVYVAQSITGAQQSSESVVRARHGRIDGGLPVDVLAIVFSYLDPITLSQASQVCMHATRCGISAAQTCRTWGSIAWRRVDFSLCRSQLRWRRRMDTGGSLDLAGFDFFAKHRSGLLGDACSARHPWQRVGSGGFWRRRPTITCCCARSLTHRRQSRALCGS